MKGLIKKELRSLPIFSPFWLILIAISSAFMLWINSEDAIILLFPLYQLPYSAIVARFDGDEKNGWLQRMGVFPVSKEQYFYAKSFGVGISTLGTLLLQWTLAAVRLSSLGSLTPERLIPLYLATLSLALTMSTTLLPPQYFAKKVRVLWRALPFICVVLSYGNFVLAYLLSQTPDSLLYWCLLALFALICAALACMTVKKKANLFEQYQLGIPSELQREE